MGKLGRAHLDVIEEWTPIDPSDPQALIEEGRKLKFLISLLLKVQNREQLEQSKRIEKENGRIRRKAGLAA